MKILFLGDIVGNSGCKAVTKYLPKKIAEHQIDFVIANGENAASNGVGITEEITNNFFFVRGRCYNDRKSCLGSKGNN